MNVAAVIKASRKSRHFPGRYETRIGGKPLLAFLIDRLRRSAGVNELILNTSDAPMDDSLVEAVQKMGIKSIRGPYGDSLRRVALACEATEADVILKVPGHYPLIDPIQIDRLIERFLSSACRYGFNDHSQGTILGMGAEIALSELILEMDDAISDQVHRDLGTLSFRSLLDPDDILRVDTPDPRANYRVTMTVPEDALYINKIVEACSDLSLEGITRYLDDNPILVKYAQRNIEGPQEVGLDKLYLFPNKLAALNEAVQNDNLDATYPVSVELSLTNRCNLNCKWCSDADLRKRGMEDLDLETIQSLLDDLARNGTCGIVVEGGGEPTVYPYFDEVVRYGKELGLSFGLITNGLRLPTDETLASFDWIRFSLDAATPEQFKAGKGKDGFQRVLANIRSAAALKNTSGLTVGVGYVLTNENEHSLEDLVLTLKKFDVDYIQIRPVIDHPELMPANLDLTYLTKHAVGGFNVATHNLKENIITGNFDLPCRAHSLSTVVTANGNVYLCGRLNKHEEILPIGNLHDSSFHDIWLGEERRKQNRDVGNQNFCTKWCPECRMTKYNILLNRLAKIKTRNFI